MVATLNVETYLTRVQHAFHHIPRSGASVDCMQPCIIAVSLYPCARYVHYSVWMTGRNEFPFGRKTRPLSSVVISNVIPGYVGFADMLCNSEVVDSGWIMTFTHERNQEIGSLPEVILRGWLYVESDSKRAAHSRAFPVHPTLGFPHPPCAPVAQSFSCANRRPFGPARSPRHVCKEWLAKNQLPNAHSHMR